MNTINKQLDIKIFERNIIIGLDNRHYPRYYFHFQPHIPHRIICQLHGEFRFDVMWKYDHSASELV